MNPHLKKVAASFLALLVAVSVSAQQGLTRERILSMTTEELSELPLEDLMAAVEMLGVSSVDELFALIMNKAVSSASKQEEDSFTSPLSTTVVTRDEMRSYGVSTIEEAFRLIPGMIVTEKTNGIYDIQMRGLNGIPDNNMLLYTENANTLLLIDGRSVNNISMGSINFDMLPIGIEDIERIEVVRGAASALYGANAVTGVINILTQKPDNSQTVVSGDIQMGNGSTLVGNVAFRKALSPKWAIGATINVQHRERPTGQMYVIPAAGVYMTTPSGPAVKTRLSQQELAAHIAAGSLVDMSGGGYVSVDDLDNLRQVYNQDGGYVVYRALEPETPAVSMFPNPQLARRTEGYNGYVAFTPADGIRFDLSGGYQRSYINSTPVGDDYFSFNGREAKTGYVALQATIKDLKVLASYSGGPHDYAVGVPGFKVNTNFVNASVEYDFHAGPVTIRPGVSYQRIYYEDYVPTYDNLAVGYGWKYHDPGYKYQGAENHQLSGFFGSKYDAEINSVAPALRVDYRVGGLRLIGAFRTDKTNIPDKWNHSWQFSANYSVNDKNFIRLVYGRANRSAIMVNSNANFRWTRTDLLMPSVLQFSADPEAGLVKTDNYEIGYRVKPSRELLIDAEAFFSHSSDFGALMGQEAYIRANGQDVMNYFSGASSVAQLINSMQTCASIKYGVLPYKVNQFGVSLNVDWIISPKVIAKLNANFQKTLIDNYYQYSQSEVLASLLTSASTTVRTQVAQISAQLAQIQGNTSLTEEERQQQVSQFIAQTTQQFAPNYDSGTGSYTLGRTTADDIRALIESGQLDMTQASNQQVAGNFGVRTENGVENKTTPNFYGMLGIIYRPLQRLNIAAFANYLGKRTFATKYNSEGVELSRRLTVNLKIGYTPVSNVELFFNAHNLLNNKKREFVYSDEIPGLYTVGVNFGF